MLKEKKQRVYRRRNWRFPFDRLPRNKAQRYNTRLLQLRFRAGN